MKYYDVLDWYTETIPLPTLKPGMCVLIYTDKGPGGPCGQSIRITCPHAAINFYPDYDSMKADVERKGIRHGTRYDLRYYVVGEYGDGQLSINVHENCFFA